MKKFTVNFAYEMTGSIEVEAKNFNIGENHEKIYGKFCIRNDRKY